MDTRFPERNRRLRKNMARLGKELPAVVAGFGRLHGAATTGGALDARTKELMALAIAIAIRCEGCIAYHMQDALETGASRKEVLDTIGVAVLMGGGPAMVYATEALKALDQFERAGIDRPDTVAVPG